tara:strand:- start:93 stop:215 length:123 start_codon:yes stop_codon:yes gene_type:complete
LLKSGAEYEMVLIDATETPIGRPKKAKTLLYGNHKNTNSN